MGYRNTRNTKRQRRERMARGHVKHALKSAFEALSLRAVAVTVEVPLKSIFMGGPNGPLTPVRELPEFMRYGYAKIDVKIHR